MKEAMHAEGGGAVLVHCYAGVSRSASCVIAFLMQECGLTFMEAMTYVRKKRPIVFPNFGFQRQLMEFEKALRAKNPNHFSLGGLKKLPTAQMTAIRPQSSANPSRGSSDKIQTAVSQEIDRQKKQRGFRSSQNLAIKTKDKMAYLQSMSKMIQSLQV